MNQPKPSTNESHRAEIIQRAIAKYVSTGMTLNITDALRMYLKNDAGPDEQIPLFITSPFSQALRTVLHTFRPTCEECDTPLNLQIGATDPKGRKWTTAWICPKCHRIEYSDRSQKEWLEILTNEVRQQDNRAANEPNV